MYCDDQEKGANHSCCSPARLLQHLLLLLLQLDVLELLECRSPPPRQHRSTLGTLNACGCGSA